MLLLPRNALLLRRFLLFEAIHVVHRVSWVVTTSYCDMSFIELGRWCLAKGEEVLAQVSLGLKSIRLR